MLRIYMLQISYNMTPGESAILQFHHLLEEHNLIKQVLVLVNDGIIAVGLVFFKRHIVDASFIEAPSSTKNRDYKRDSEMSSGKKRNTWHFGMKMHVATGDLIGIVTNVVYGPVNEHDGSRARELISSETEQVYGDAGYVGMETRQEFQTDKDAEKRKYRINLRLGVLKGCSAEDIVRQVEHLKSSVRSKVEHVFARVKLQMAYRKTWYRGIAKNARCINTMLALCNLFTVDCSLRSNCAYIIGILTRNIILRSS